MNRKLKTKKKSNQEKEEEPSALKKRPILKEKYKNFKNWLEEDEFPENIQSYSPDPKNTRH